MADITYVVACFLGKKRMHANNQPPPYFYINKHLEFLSRLGKNNLIKKAVFVINGGGVEKLEAPGIKIPIEIINRNNIDFSYGAWEESILNDINKKSISDYYFLIEDDYLPQKTTFYKNFIKKMDAETAFVCQLLLETPPESVGGIKKYFKINIKVPTKHPAISNGLINGKLCEKVFKEYNQIFRLTNSNVYNFGEYNQIIFLEYFLSQGYNIKDVCDCHASEFSTSSNKFVVYGDPKKSIVIRPIKREDP